MKALGNREGAHVLAFEWVAANLASLMSMRTFQFAIMPIMSGDEIPLGHDRRAAPGPAFITKEESGYPWSGNPDELKYIKNQHDISQLVVFDTWIRNRDRFCLGRKPNYDNVFLSTQYTTGKYTELVAMDHTHCFSNKSELTPEQQHVEYIQDELIYGAFPGFKIFVDEAIIKSALEKINAISGAEIACIINSIPREWEVPDAAKNALCCFLTERARWLSAKDARAFMPRG